MGIPGNGKLWSPGPSLKGSTVAKREHKSRWTHRHETV